MKKKSFVFQGRDCVICLQEDAEALLIQPVDARDLKNDTQYEAICRRTDRPFLFLGFAVVDWNSELSPWEAPPVFGKEGFGAGAADTLRFTEKLIEKLKTETGAAELPVLLGGYSLAGLFALWSAYRTDRLRGVMAASPSLWFPGWEEYAADNDVRAPYVYLSLGDREEKTKNPVMAKVGDRLRRQYERLCADPAVSDCCYEMNEGGHFREAEERCAKGFAWLLERI